MSAEPKLEPTYGPITVLGQTERLTDIENAFLRAALAETIKAEAVKAFLMGQLSIRYNLVEGDQITPDGVIVRKS
jgi:hypothetical protein